jgi:hypothetical protein
MGQPKKKRSILYKSSYLNALRNAILNPSPVDCLR